MLQQLPQYNKDEKLVGIITASDIVRAFSQTTANPSLESIITGRVFSIDYGSRISSAIDIMFEKRIGSIIVNKGGIPYGIFTESDLSTRVLSEEVRLDKRVGDYCTNELITAEIGNDEISAADAVQTTNSKDKKTTIKKGS